MHVADRQKLMEEYRKQNLLLFQQWETDLEKTRENEEKLQVVTAVDLIRSVILIIIVQSFYPSVL